MRMNTFAAVAALVVALGTGSAFAADATAGASGAGSAGVSTDTSNTNLNAAGNADVNAAANTGGAGASGSAGASGELGVDLAAAGTDASSRQQFFASLSADQQADVRGRCTAAGSDKASIEASSLSADAKAMCEVILNLQ